MVITRQATHPAPNWRLVGPWYRWAHPALPADGRVSRPTIQKFAGDDFIKDFLARPQHSLKYDEVIDVVNSYQLAEAGSFAARVLCLLPLTATGKPAPKYEADGTTISKAAVYRARLAPTSLRKLYQPAHDRHYLVTCELHCDEPGFPRVARQQVCQAGFVVRRRISRRPDGLSAESVTEQAKAAQTMAADLRELLSLDDAGARDAQDSVGLSARELQQQQALRANALRQQALLVALEHQPSWPALLADKRRQLEAERERLQQWYDEHGVRVDIEGWFPTLQDGKTSRVYGEWRRLDSPAKIFADVAAGEQSYPLFAIVPDPREAQHDAAGRTLYYGTVPTGGVQHDANGVARFDDLMTYEIRCFVRQHHPCPPRIGKTPDCHGPLVWSLPSEAFRVAAPFDVLGAANRPITIKMPDLRELAAQAATRPRGKLSPVRFVQPQHLSPKVKDSAVDGGEMGGEAICSFSIPLITIIALFVLSLFLPIVVFIFNLWFLLVFRFCIPPQIKVAAGLDAALAVTPPKVDLDADFSVKVDGVDTLIDTDDLHAALTTGSDSLKTRIKSDVGIDQDPAIDDLSNNNLGPIDQTLQDNAERLPASDGTLPPPPPVGTPLVYEDPVTPVWPATGGAKRS
ncbi:conserved hypothetical protein [Candidatus Accumulibacter aalborgensis]|uniref:Uncharacterized protein n=1 Tax=Candidatus Accumulibacter aalborgensis TaxID=1860102 RepID=A0A1A8XQS6_9PROT|nr:hypothetical protein [Candidatus Accumulibacter aalborgensis]SBT07499.1 conserved hypothetical protein [Candidatus Accumulibacter aalborgensis]